MGQILALQELALQELAGRPSITAVVAVESGCSAGPLPDSTASCLAASSKASPSVRRLASDLVELLVMQDDVSRPSGQVEEVS